MRPPAGAGPPGLPARAALGLCMVALVATAAGCSPRPDPGSPSDVDRAALRDVESIAARALAERQVPGLSLVVLREEEVVLARGYGVAAVGAPEAVGPETEFQLGSISKQFLSTLVLRLAERGLLSIDDPVRRHLPELENVPREVTLRHLMNHTSGLREPFTLPEYQAGIEDLGRGPDEMVAILRGVPADFPAGRRWSYSNANYQLLALVVEEVTGTPYEEALAHELFRPLGLSSLRHCTPLPRDGEARGHVLADERVVHAVPENMHWIRGDGGLCGNALDVAHWWRRLAAGEVVSARSYRTMIAPTRLADGSAVDYGLGISLVPLDGLPKVAHNGAMLGHSASAAHYPGADLTVVVLTNRGGVRTESIERPIARRLLGLPPPDLGERPLSAEERRAFVGTYDIGVFSVGVVERDGALWIEAPPPGPKTRLRHLGGGSFVSDADPDAYRVDFVQSPRGVEGLRLFMGAMHWYAPRPG